MKRGRRLFGLLGGLVAWMVLWCAPLVAQLPTTTIDDVVYRADGTPAGGSVVISWGAFTTQAGVAVAAGTKTVTLASDGTLDVQLAPNSGGTPMGTYYTVVFHLNDGTTQKQFWSVPAVMAGSSPTKLATIRATVLPTSVAMQTVSKQYVDNAIAAAQAGQPFDSSPYVVKAGDTMTGPLVLPGDPLSPNQAADMHYVDANVAALTGALNTKVSTVPGVTQIVAQPTGTQLEVNNLNGELYATQYIAGSGSSGIISAASSSDCVSGCEIKAEPTYPGVDSAVASLLPQKTQVVDERGGARVHTALDPLPVNSYGQLAAVAVTNTSTRSAAQVGAMATGGTLSSYAQVLTNNGLTGGNNQFPQNTGSGVPYFKSTYGVQSLVGNYNTEGQKVQLGNTVNCYGIGDCIAGGQYITSYGGVRDDSDEGVHPWDLQITESNITFTGTCQSGCTTGSTQVTVAATIGGGTQGEGRYLIDKNPAKTISTGAIIPGVGTGPLSIASFSGTNFTPSVFFELASAVVAQPHNMVPGTVTVPIATSGIASYFATNTAVVPASGVACIAELGIPNYEMASYTVVDGTHLQMTFNKVHANNAMVGIGGMCGYGLEQTVDTVGAVRQVFPVLGSVDGVTLSYVGFLASYVGQKNSLSGYLSDLFTIASLSRTSNVTTVTLAAPIAENVNGLTMTIAGVADSSYNGSYVVTTTSSTTLTYANTGANSTSTGGTVSIQTGGFALYPMAEVLGVYNATTKRVDGTLQLGANTAPWAAGDVVEQPHFYLNRIAADVEYITQFEPRLIQRLSAGKTYQGRVGPQLYGWEINNAAATTDYYGGGGTHQPPAAAYSVLGVWSNDMEMQAGNTGVFRIHCNAHGCGRWDSKYYLATLDAHAGTDTIAFEPYNDTLTNVMGGTSYSFSPSAFTAPTINVTTLNATTITGSIAGAGITGTIPVAAVPVFGPSGATHSSGAVPDPGATAGSARYLREDGTWQVPAGGSGTGSLGGGAAYTIPYQSGVGATSMLASPTTNGTYFLTEAPTAGVAAQPVWTNATTYLASPPAIGATAPGNVYANLLSVKGGLSTFGSGTALLSTSAYEAYMQANSTGTNAAGYIANRASTSGSASFDLLTASTSSGWSMQMMAGSTNYCLLDRVVSSTACRVSIASGGAIALGLASASQVVASGSAPTMVAGSAAGSSPTCTTVTGANMAGVISCTTGSGTSASATLATVTFNGGLATAPQGCELMPRNAAAASAVTTIFTTAPTTTGWSVGVGATALGASTTYSWSYHCI